MSWHSRELLAASDQLLSDHPRLLRAAGAVRGFHDGARWMRLAINSLRDESVPFIKENLNLLGCRKYLACSIGATTWIAICVFLRLWSCIPIAVIVFYLFETRFVFVFPLRLDQPANHLPHALLVRTSGGTMRIVWIIMAIAIVMVLGGVMGRGFVRSWCLGCGAVVIWYENARMASHIDAT